MKTIYIAEKRAHWSFDPVCQLRELRRVRDQQRSRRRCELALGCALAVSLCPELGRAADLLQKVSPQSASTVAKKPRLTAMMKDILADII